MRDESRIGNHPSRRQVLGGDSMMLFYVAEAGSEGKNAFREGRKPDFSKFSKRP